MPKITLESNSIRFVDTRGIYRYIYGCPLKQRRELDQSLTDLDDRLNKSHCKTIHDLYDHDPEFQAIADHCLSLCKIDPDWLDIDMLQQFLLSFEAEGQAQVGLLRSLNFPDLGNSGSKAATYEEAIAAAWSHTEDLRSALTELGYDPDEQLSWDELSKVMQARAKALDPDAAEKAEIEALSQDVQGFADLGFNGGGRMATPDEVAALLGG